MVIKIAVFKLKCPKCRKLAKTTYVGMFSTDLTYHVICESCDKFYTVVYIDREIGVSIWKPILKLEE